MKLPNWVNKLLNTHNKNKDSGKLTGITYIPRIDKWMVKCSLESGRVTIGYYSSTEVAIKAYAHAKESYVQRVAQSRRNELTEDVYNYMMNWKVS